MPPQQQPHWVAAAKSKPILDALGTELVALLPKNAEDLILRKLKPKAPDDTAEAPADAKTAPAKTGEAPAYRNGEKKQLEQMIGNSGKAP